MIRRPPRSAFFFFLSRPRYCSPSLFTSHDIHEGRPVGIKPGQEIERILGVELYWSPVHINELDAALSQRSTAYKHHYSFSASSCLILGAWTLTVCSDAPVSA